MVEARFRWAPESQAGELECDPEASCGGGEEETGFVLSLGRALENIGDRSERIVCGRYGSGGLRSCGRDVTARPATVGRLEGGMGPAPGFWLRHGEDGVPSARAWRTSAAGWRIRRRAWWGCCLEEGPVRIAMRSDGGWWHSGIGGSLVIWGPPQRAMFHGAGRRSPRKGSHGCQAREVPPLTHV